MKIYFFRHGKALDREGWEEDDALRPLSAEGLVELERLASSYARVLAPDAILSSPFERAWRSASILASALGSSEGPVRDDRLRPGFGLGSLKEILSEREEAGSLLLVGHEPDMSHVISAVCGGLALSLDKGGLARVDWGRKRITGRLEWLASPKFMLEALGD